VIGRPSRHCRGPVAYFDNTLISQLKQTEGLMCEPLPAVRLTIPAGVEMGEHAQRQLTGRDLQNRGWILDGVAEPHARLVMCFECTGWGDEPEISIGTFWASSSL
jgi:hypothetical protein